MEKHNWYIWLFPIIALLICGWLFLDYLKQQGPLLNISFADASNIEAGKTHVRYRGVTIGIVQRITISEDAKDVIVVVALHPDAKQFAVEGTKFWVVTPKVNFSGVSGLETLFAGPYITVQPGKHGGETKSEFRGQLGGDANEAIENTSIYYLETSNAESLRSGDAVTFRGVNIGIIDKIVLTKSAQTALIQINIHNKYIRLVRTNSVFWKKIGIQSKLGIFGSEIIMNSFESILHGGVEVFTPNNPGPLAHSHARFILQLQAPKDFEKWNPILELDHK